MQNKGGQKNELRKLFFMIERSQKSTSTKNGHGSTLTAANFITTLLLQYNQSQRPIEK